MGAAIPDAKSSDLTCTPRMESLTAALITI
jgi:hypothetical protein